MNRFRSLLLIFGFFGGVLFWVLKGFKNTFDEEISDKFLWRNIVTGFLVFLTSGLIYDQYQKNKTIERIRNEREEMKPITAKINYTDKGTTIYLIRENGDTIK